MANYKLPTTGKVTQGFGADPAWYKRVIGQKGHNGIDYGVPVGTPVRATADGVVAFEGWGQNHSWMGRVAGICAILRHSNGHSGYAHLSRTIVDIGQKVKAGQVIGYSGATGLTNGPHLHFETLPLTPNFKNGFAGRVNPSTFNLGVPDKPKAPAKKYYTVKKGDTLSGIAAAHKTTYQNLMKFAENKKLIKNVNVIQPGWKVRVK